MGAGGCHRANQRCRTRSERRRVAGRHCHRHANRHGPQARYHDRNRWLVRHSEPDAGSVSPRGDASGLPQLPADGHHTTGRRIADRQRDHGDRRGGRDDYGASERLARRDEEPRRRSGDDQQAGPRTAAERPEHGRPAGAASRVGADAGRERDQPQHGRRQRWHRVFAGGRSELRSVVCTRWRDTQQPVRQLESAAAVPRRDRRVQGRDERHDGAERHAFRGSGKRHHQVGHQFIPRERLRVLPPSRDERDGSIRGQGRQRQSQGRRPQAQSVRRDARRTDCEGPAVLLPRLSGHERSSGSDR